MPLQITCPRCHAPFTVADQARGRVVQCLTCGQPLAVETAAAPAPAASDVLEAQVVGRTSAAGTPGASANAWSDVWTDDSAIQSGDRTRARLRRCSTDAPSPPRRRRSGRTSEEGSRTTVVLLTLAGLVAGAVLLFGGGMLGVWFLARRAPEPRWAPAPVDANEMQAPMAPMPPNQPGIGQPPGNPAPGGFGPGAGVRGQPGFGPGAGPQPGVRNPGVPGGPRQGPIRPGPVPPVGPIR